MEYQAMSPEHDRLLLAAPWLGKRDQHGKTHLVKYAHTPDGSYVFLTTDLTSVQSHAPTLSEISTALWDSSHPFVQLAQEAVQSSEVEESEDQAAFVVKRLEEMAGRWDEVQLLLDEDDQAMYLKVDDFGWRFPVSPLDPLSQLPIISRHLLSPLTTLLAQDRGIPLPPSPSEAEGTIRLISDPEISRGIKRVSVSASASASASVPYRTSSVLPSVSEPGPSSTAGSPTPRKPVRNHRAQDQERDKTASPAPFTSTKDTTHETRSKSMAPPSSSHRSSVQPASSPLNSSPPPLPSSSLAPLSSTPLNSSPPPEPPATALAPSLAASKKPARDRAPVQDVPPSSSPSIGSAMDFKPPTQALTQGTSQTQKTKREREKEEEEEVERKLKEMRKRMESGKAGKLGKRRLAR